MLFLIIYLARAHLQSAGTHLHVRERIGKKILKSVSTELKAKETKFKNRIPCRNAGVGQVSGMIKKYYTNNYKSLDRFDQLWYEINYPHTDQRWRTCITWSLILTCVITSRSAYCEAKNGSLSTKNFVDQLIQELANTFRIAEHKCL